MAVSLLVHVPLHLHSPVGRNKTIMEDVVKYLARQPVVNYETESKYPFTWGGHPLLPGLEAPTVIDSEVVIRRDILLFKAFAS